MKEEAARKNEKLTGILRKIYFIDIPNTAFGRQSFIPFINILLIFFISFNSQQEIIGQNYSFTRSIQQSSDDAEEHGTDGEDPNNAGNMLLNSLKLEMVRDDASPSRGAQKIGLRFTDINIPKGATILNAYISFNGAEVNTPNSNSSATSLTIHGQSANSPNTFNTNNNNISGRALTTASVNWNNIQAWNEDVNYNTPSITSIVQELVNRPGWNSGNNMAFIISGSGSRTAQSWDAGGDSPPLLTIEYSIVTLSTAVTPVTVQGASNGAIDLTISGGTPAYTYLWSNGATTQHLTNIPVGTYTVTVTDSFGNTASATAIVNDVDVKKQLYLSGPGQLMDRIDPTVHSESIKYSDGIYAGAVKLGNSSFAMGNNVNSITLSHTTPVDTELRYMLVGVSARNRDNVAVSNVTYNGLVLSLVASVNNGQNARTWIYALQNPPIGTYNVVVSFNANLTRGAVVGATTFSGVHPDTPLGTPATAINNNNNITLAIPSSEGDMIFNTVTKRNASSSFSSSEDQRWNGYTSETRGAASTTSAHPTNSSTSIGWTAANGSEVAIAGVALKPEVGNLTTSFTQSPAVCSNLIIKSGQILVRTYVNILEGTMPANPKVSATLKYDNNNIIILNNPTFNSTNQYLTWTGNLGSDFTVPSGKAITLEITTSERNLLFQIAYDHSTKASLVEFTTSTYIDITQTKVFDAPFPGGSEITSAQNGSTVYIRNVVTDPFGYEDITANTLNFSPTPAGTFNSVPVANTTCSRTYEYAWTTPPTPGDYQITATAKEGYENTVVHVKKIDFSLCPLTVSANVQTFPTCSSPNSGVLNIQISGGSGTLTWARWNGQNTTNGSTNVNSFNMSGLSSGSYTITVTSARGCTGTTTIVIPVPLPPDVSGDITHVTCFGGNNGTITQTLTGGLTPYSYLWTGGNTSKDRSGLVSGTYNVTITDAGGCSTTRSYQVNQPSQLTFSLDKQDPTCSQTGSLSFTVNGGGGSAPYAWNWSRISPAATGSGSGYNINDLSQGTYNITVTSGAGCTGTGSISLTLPTPPIADALLTHITCHGLSDGFINQIVSSGTPPYNYTWQNSDITARNRSNLSAGTYRVTISDTKDCEIIKEYTITQPGELNLEITPIHKTCNTNGLIEVQISGGNEPYTFDWEDLSGITNSKNRNGLSAGNYSVTVSDASQCTASGQANIQEAQCGEAKKVCISDVPQRFSTEPDPMVDEYFWTVPAGAIIISGQGTESVLIDWSDVDPGQGSVCVRKINQCGESLDYCENLNIQRPEIEISANQPVCDGNNLRLLGNGGTTYQWTGPSAFMSSEANPVIYGISPLHTGYYYVTVSDGSGCVSNDSIWIEVQDKPLSSMVIYNASCGAANGFANLSVVGGSAPYQYQWSNGVTLQDNAAVPKGKYSVTITDNNGCSITDYANIDEVGGPVIMGGVFHVNCHKGTNGEIQLEVTGGTTPYTYYWSDGNDEKDRVNLKAGNYTVTVLDANGCGSVESFMISEPNPLFTNSILTHVGCYNQPTGSIALYPSGGTGPYSYVWNDNSTQSSRNNLPAGIFNVTITDNNNCQLILSYQITQPDTSLYLQVVKSDITCTGGQNGTIDLLASGGTGPYSFAWNSIDYPSFSSTSEDLKNLAAGTYQVTVTDSKACSQTASVSISIPETISITNTKSNVTCFKADDGYIDIIVTGGNSPFHYAWSDGIITKDRIQLRAGIYRLTVTDSTFCTGTAEIIISEPAEITANAQITHVACFGQSTGAITMEVNGGISPYLYQWSNSAATKDISNLNSGEFAVTITDDNNCTATARFWIEHTAPFSSDEFVRHVSCNGGNDGAIDFIVRGGIPPYTYEWSNGDTTASIENLTEGPYWVTFTDANQCSASSFIFVFEPTSLFVAFDKSNPECWGSNTGSITAYPSGGFGPYTYKWSNASAQQQLSDLAAGKYIVTVTDSKGCNLIDSTSLISPSKIDVWGDVVNNCPGQSNGSIFVYASGGTPPYIYTWSDFGPASSVRTDLSAGVYIVTVTDNNNCSSEITFTLSPLQASLLAVQPTCKMTGPGNAVADTNGEIYITASGGTGSYSYFWSNGANGNEIKNLANGNYSITITSGACAVILNTALSSGFCLPPVAEDDYYVTENTVPVSGNVALNDYDLDHQYPLTVLPLGFIDPEIGVIEWDTSFNGSFEFIPHADYLGSFNVPYLVCDTSELCAQALLHITVSQPILGLTKKLASVPLNIGQEDYEFSFIIEVHNMSALTLDSITVTDDLEAAFTGSDGWIITDVTSNDFELNPYYNGNSDKQLLNGNNQLGPLSSGSITISIQITPGGNLGPYYNSASVRGKSPKGVILMDISQDGDDPDPDMDGDPTNDNEPTPVQLCPYVAILGNTTICAGSSSQLTSVSNGVWYSTHPSVAQVNEFGIVVGLSAGRAAFYFIEAASGCVTNTTDSILVQARPITSITGSDNICARSTSTLSPQNGGVWTSSNTNIAAVNNAGVVTGVSEGVAQFFFTNLATGCTSEASAPVTIRANPDIYFDADSVVCVGEIAYVSPKTDGVWTSSNPLVASLDQDGTLTGISNGITYLSFITETGCTTGRQLPFVVNGNTYVYNTGANNVCAGAQLQLMPNVNGTWVSNTPSIAQITTDGIVTGLSEGVAHFSFTDSGSGCESELGNIQVNARPLVSFAGADTLCTGSSTNLSPDMGGFWISSHPEVATVSSTGIVNAINPGKSSFTFVLSSTGCSSLPTDSLVVFAKPEAYLLDENPVCQGDNTQLFPTTGGNWFATNPAIATVTQEGIVTALAQGSTRFIFVSEPSGCASNPTAILVIHDRPEIALNGLTGICEGQTAQIFPSDGGIWTSTQPSVAMISQSGQVQAIGPGNVRFNFMNTTTGCLSDTSTAITVYPAPQISISGDNRICSGFRTQLSPQTGGVWTSSNNNVGIVNNNGLVTALSAGAVRFSFTESTYGCASLQPTEWLIIDRCLNPDFNVTSVNVPVNGDVSTNDVIPPLTSYGSIPVLIDHPGGSNPHILMHSNGTYVFVTDMPGVYRYNVDVCFPGVSGTCPTTFLEIYVNDLRIRGNYPVANTDRAGTWKNPDPLLSGIPVTLPTLANDKCLNGGGCALDTFGVIITIQPNFGMAAVNPLTGDITYTPGPGFAGMDFLYYKVCVLNEPENCSEAIQIIDVLSQDYLGNNTTDAVDDFYFTYKNQSVSGNVLLNDSDNEEDVQSVTVLGNAQNPLEIYGGSFHLSSNGDFTFVPDTGFYGTAQFSYQVCDDNPQQQCAKATVYIYVIKDLTMQIRAYLEGALIQNNNVKAADGRPLMRDNLRQSGFTGQNYLPDLDPYSFDTEFVQITSRYNHKGPGTLFEHCSVAQPAQVFGVTGQDAIVDWIFIELRSGNDSTEVVATRSGLLQRDGDIVDVDGISPLSFPLVGADSFYVVVRHRNHLGMMSQKICSKDLVDLTTADSKAFDFGASLNNGYDYSGLGRKCGIQNGYCAMWAGDFNTDGKLKFINPNDDQNILFFDVFAYPDNLINSANFNFGYGYIQGDFDLDGKAKYDNPNDDKNLLFSQILLYPLNTNLLSNFNFLIEQVPPRKN
jgi:hypothetical protein